MNRLQAILFACGLGLFSIAQAADFDTDLAASSGSTRWGSRYSYSSLTCTGTYGTASLWVYIVKPKGYDDPGNTNRYSTVYAFDGTSAMDAESFDWVQVADDLSDQHLIDPVLVVGIGNPPPAIIQREEFLGLDAYKTLAFLTNQLVPYIDTTYRTIANPSNRVVGGHSLGGHMAIFAGWKGYKTFGRILALSPSIWASYAWIQYYGSVLDDMRAWPRSDTANRKSKMRIVVDCGNSENAYTGWSPKTQGYTQADMAADTARFAFECLTNGWGFGENIVWSDSGRYHADLTRHDGVKGMLVGRSGLYFLLRTNDMVLNSVEITPKNLWRWDDPGQQVFANRMDLANSNSSWSVEMRAHFAPYFQFCYPDWRSFTSDAPSVASITNLTCAIITNAPALPDWGQINTHGVDGGTLIRGTLVYKGSNYTATLAVNVDSFGATNGAAAGLRGGTNQLPEIRRSTWVVGTNNMTRGTLPGYDPEGAALNWLPVYTVGGRSGIAVGGYVSDWPGNVIITNFSTGGFAVYPAGPGGRVSYLYTTHDGGLESLPCMAMFYFGYPRAGLSNGAAAFSMLVASASNALSSNAVIAINNVGSDDLPRPLIAGVPAWLDAQVSGTNTPYTLTLALNQTQANLLAAGINTATLQVVPGEKRVLLPEADTFHRPGISTAYGMYKYDYVNNISAARNMLLRWNLSSVTGSVLKATIRIKAQYRDAIDLVKLADDTWDEYTTVGTSYTIINGGTLGTFPTNVVSDVWAEMDVTDYVEAQRTNDGKASCYLTSAGTQQNRVYTREDLDDSPELVIICAGNPPADAIANVQVSLTVTNPPTPPLSLPFSETFETSPTNMAGILGVLNGQHGWVSDSSGNVVTTNKAHSGFQSLEINDGMVSHNFSATTGVVQISYWAMPTMGATNSFIPADATAVFWFGTNGQVMAYSNSQLLVVGCSVVTGAWNKFDITCDYTAQVWRLNLNGTNVIQNFGFYSSQSAFSEFIINNSSLINSYVDDVNISNATAALPPVYYLLTVNSMLGGSVNPTGGVYLAGSNVQISASASNYYHFTQWSGGLSNTSNPATVTMTTNLTVQAAFAENLVTNNTPAWWLAQNGLATNDAGALSDTDGDGLTAWQEYLAGTVPTNAASVFQITGLSIPGSTIVRWSTVSGRVYTVYWTSNLLSGFQQTLGTNISWTRNVFTDSTHSAEQQGFYQIKVRLAP